MPLRARTRMLSAILLLSCTLVAHLAAAECCIVADNGAGTATLPPMTTGATCVYLGTSQIVDGLPPGSSIQMSVSIGNFINVVESPGGGLGGTIASWDGLCDLAMTGTGALTGFSRNITISLVGFQNNMMQFAPRTPFAPTQTAAADEYRLFGQIPTSVDPDFDFLRITGGSDFGMPSPGQVQLVSTGGGWAVSGYFDLTHRFDFIGAPGGPLAGMSGSTTLQRRFEICPENAVAVEKVNWSQLKATYR